MMQRGMRGYNGNLSLAEEGVTIERGLKGLLVRKQQSTSLLIRCGDVREVWFQPSAGRWRLPGYVLVLTGPESPPENFVARIRDDRTVTFLAHSDQWRELAAATARQCRVALREFPAEARSALEVAKTDWPGDARERRF
jgi:hypothetical protein